MSHGALLYILANRLYLGEVVHRGKAYPGQHRAIIDAQLFEAVQNKLTAGAPALPGIASKGRAASLLGKLFDAQHHPMTSAHANKNGRRYFYYVSTPKSVLASGAATRVSAPNLEQRVLETVAPLLAATWRPHDAQRVFAAVEEVVLATDSIAISIAGDAVASHHAGLVEGLTREGDAWRLCLQNTLRRPSSWRGVISSTTAAAPPRIDRTLVRAIVQARRWAQMLASGEAATRNDLARSENLCPHYTGQLLPLAFLAPDLVGAILDGRQPARLTLARLIARPLPLTFEAQRTLFAQFA
jgi:site-specific DNA recombinase